MEQKLNGKHFSITDPKGVKTVIYEVSKTDKETAKNGPKFTVERLDFDEQIIGEKSKKTFYVNEPKPEGNRLAIFSFGKEKVVINNGMLTGKEVIIAKEPLPFHFKNMYSEEETEFKEFIYTPNLKRPISIIDPETTEEVKPILYIDESTQEVKGKCKLKPFKNYFAFEIRPGEGNDYTLLGGSPVIEE